MHRTAVKKVVRENVLDANDTLARANRDTFDSAGTYTINMMSSPGAGKTALLERMKQREGEVTDRFLVNFVEHQISRIEVSS